MKNVERGWLKIQSAAQYVDVSPRTLRSLLKGGELKHSHLRSGTILIRVSDLDDFLEKFAVKDRNAINEVADDILRDFPKLNKK